MTDADPDAEPAVAVTWADPFASAVTTPDAFTDATAASDDVQVTA